MRALYGRHNFCVFVCLFIHVSFISFFSLSLFLQRLKDNSCDAPVMLVANKIDQYGDRMVFVEDGQRRYREIGCVGFREISVRESIEQVHISYSFTINRQVYFHCWQIARSFFLLLQFHYFNDMVYLVVLFSHIHFDSIGLGCFP